MPTSLSDRDRSEIERSAAEAARLSLKPAEVDRYLDPPADTAFSLEYAFHLLGDIHGKTVLDLGCGTGENLIALARRGARVLAIDLSPELVELARRRLEKEAPEPNPAMVQVGSAYETGLPDESVDIVFCMALLHHLDLGKARAEIYRILRPGGRLILREPIRFSSTLRTLRKLFAPPKADVSEFEHPLTREELAMVTRGFAILKERRFRLPLVPLLKPFGASEKRLWKLDGWLLKRIPGVDFFATSVVMSLAKQA